MPIYEYQCTECGQLEEVVQKISDPPLSECSGCSGKMQKIISQTSFHLKGGGWYADAYSSTPAKGSDVKDSNVKDSNVKDSNVKDSNAKAKTGNPPDTAPAAKKASDA